MKNLDHIQSATPHQDISDVLSFLARGIRDLFGDDLVGFYLAGSLSYGDFVADRSDIDLTVLLKSPALPEQLPLIKELHEKAERRYARWARRVECSYVPLEMLGSVLPPAAPRPYFGAGIFYPEADYGNEWIINQYFLYNYGIALIGPEFKTLVAPIDIADVKQACIRDLHKEWEPIIGDPDRLQDSHLQSYVVLNLCRILYTVMEKDARSKKVAAAWAQEKFPRWKSLIETADAWNYGTEMQRQDQVVDFIRFALEITG